MGSTRDRTHPSVSDDSYTGQNAHGFTAVEKTADLCSALTCLFPDAAPSQRGAFFGGEVAMTISMALQRIKGEPRNLSELMGLLTHSNGRVAELIDICSKQRDVGKLSVVEGTLVHAQRLLEDIRALEHILVPDLSPAI
jgi:hypothetical protein